MKKEGTSNPGTIHKPIKEDYPKLIVEKGKVLFLNRYTKEYTEAEKGKGYVLGKERNQENPVTIGREDPETMGRKDILLPRKYDCASRHHGEIFFDEKGNICLVDYSLNGTLVNGKRVGGNRVRETRKLGHEDLIEIPAGGESIQMRLLTREREGILDWSGLRWRRR